MHDKLVKRLWLVNLWQLAMLFLPWLAVLIAAPYICAKVISEGYHWLAAFLPAVLIIAATLIPIAVIFVIAQVRFVNAAGAAVPQNPKKFPPLPMMRLLKSAHGSFGAVIAGVSYALFSAALGTIIVTIITKDIRVAFACLNWTAILILCWVAVDIFARLILGKAITDAGWPRPSYSTKLVIIIMAAIPATLAIFIAIENSNLRSELDRQLEADRMKGRLFSLEDVHSLPQLNRDYFLGDIIKNKVEYDGTDVDDIRHDLLIADAGSIARERAEKLLADSRDYAKMVDKLASHTEGSYQYDFTWKNADYMTGSIEHFALYRHAVQYNALRMAIAAYDGDADAAFKFWRQSLNLQRQLADNITFSSFMTFSATNSLVIRALNDCLAAGAFSDAQIVEIIGDLRDLEQVIVRSLTTSVDFERLSSIHLSEFVAVPDALFLIPVSPLLDRIELKADLEIMKQYHRYIPSDGDIERYKNRDARYISKKEHENSSGGKYLKFVGDHDYFTSAAYYMANDSLAQARATRVLAAVELFYRSHGELPRYQEALVPDYLEKLPIDPHTGYPLIYEFAQWTPHWSETPIEVLSVRTAGDNVRTAERTIANIFTLYGGIRRLDIAR